MEIFDQAEIKDFDDVLLPSFVAQHDVLRFDIAVYDSFHVGFTQGSACTGENVDDSPRGHRSSVCHDLMQVCSLQELHHVVKDSLCCVSVVIDRDRVWMGKAAGVTDLVFESGKRLFTGNFRLQEFDGGGAGCCGLYTEGITGNTNCSVDGKLTLSDITLAIDHVYISRAPLCCQASGNTNGSADCKITLSDITALIDAVYISKNPPAECMSSCEE